MPKIINQYGQKLIFIITELNDCFERCAGAGIGRCAILLVEKLIQTFGQLEIL